jgi:hypothetical protein
MNAASKPEPLYQVSPIKRARSTEAEVDRRRDALIDIVAQAPSSTTSGLT